MDKLKEVRKIKRMKKVNVMGMICFMRTNENVLKYGWMMII